jgi:hypothetical protein
MSGWTGYISFSNSSPDGIGEPWDFREPKEDVEGRRAGYGVYLVTSIEGDLASFLWRSGDPGVEVGAGEWTVNIFGELWEETAEIGSWRSSEGELLINDGSSNIGKEFYQRGRARRGEYHYIPTKVVGLKMWESLRLREGGSGEFAALPASEPANPLMVVAGEFGMWE